MANRELVAAFVADWPSPCADGPAYSTFGSFADASRLFKSLVFCGGIDVGYPVASCGCCGNAGADCVFGPLVNLPALQDAVARGIGAEAARAGTAIGVSVFTLLASELDADAWAQDFGLHDDELREEICRRGEMLMKVAGQLGTLSKPVFTFVNPLGATSYRAATHEVDGLLDFFWASRSTCEPHYVEWLSAKLIGDRERHDDCEGFFAKTSGRHGLVPTARLAQLRNGVVPYLEDLDQLRFQQASHLQQQQWHPFQAVHNVSAEYLKQADVHLSIKDGHLLVKSVALRITPNMPEQLQRICLFEGLHSGDRIVHIELETQFSAFVQYPDATSMNHTLARRIALGGTELIKITVGFGTPELLRVAMDWNNRLVMHRMLRHANKMGGWGRHHYVLPLEVREAISDFLICNIAHATGAEVGG